MHTPEPWTRNITEINGPDGTLLAVAEWGGPKKGERPTVANAARIVACVNACAGIKDPGTAIPKLIAALRSLVHRADTTELADGFSLDTLEANIALALLSAK